jgi:uncharacterized membrane protein
VDVRSLRVIDMYNKRVSKIRLLSEVAIFSALSGLGALIPIPSPVGSIALDSFPGYFMALWRGALGGALVGAIGHLLSSFRAGFPLGPIHIAIALLMAAVGVVTAVLKKRFGIIAGLVGGVFVNVAGSVLVAPVLGWSMVPVIATFLLVASVINAAIAGIICKTLERGLRRFD